MCLSLNIRINDASSRQNNMAQGNAVAESNPKPSRQLYPTTRATVEIHVY
jgi:hypothetical protein